jgi:hypothetical protein
MSPRAFSLTAGIVFLLIAVGHILRVLFAVSFVVAGIEIPTWASVLATIFMGYLAYEAFRQGRGSRPAS